ncbi:hypothetical protein DL768_002628 [Monosporascus sp. mg162]|nr:hypothetical protein DL768_002628 [Monosporascus sp. mg162]
MLCITLTLSMSLAAAAAANIGKGAALRTSPKMEGVNWHTIDPPPPRGTKRVPSRPNARTAWALRNFVSSCM